MLEVCASIAGAKPSLEIHPLSIGGKDDPARLVFNVPSGPAINATLLDMGNRFRMVVNEVDVIQPEAPLSKLPVASAVWVPRPNLKVAAGAWILAGGAHHTGFSQSVTRAHLEDFAGMAGLEFLVIDQADQAFRIQERTALERTVLPPVQGIVKLMKVIRLHAPNDLRLHDEPEPEPGPGEALVRVQGGRHLRLGPALVQRGRHWRCKLNKPLVLGHEFAGVIAAGPRQGERVAVDPAVPAMPANSACRATPTCASMCASPGMDRKMAPCAKSSPGRRNACSRCLRRSRMPMG